MDRATPEQKLAIKLDNLLNFLNENPRFKNHHILNENLRQLESHGEKTLEFLEMMEE